MEGVIERRSVPQWDLTDGRDELNLAEFPLSCMSDRAPRGVKTLVFEDEVWDSGKNELVARRLTIAGSDDYGLPTALDEDVLVGLIKLTKEANGFADPKVHFSRYQVIRLLGWDEGGKSYKRLDESLHRWTGVTLRYKRAWWDKRGQRWKDQAFHVLESVELCGRESGDDQLNLPLSNFTWNGVLFSSFKSGYMKRLDLEIYKRLRLSGSKRAYRFLDKRFFHRRQWEFPLREFACEHLGLSRSYDNANLKRKLRSIIEELVEHGVIEHRTEADTFVKVGHGDWHVVFVQAVPVEPDTMVEKDAREASPCEEKLIRYGVQPKVAKELAAGYDEKLIQEKMELCDWYQNRQDKSMESPGGWLVKAIREDYRPPKGFKTKAQRESEAARVAERKLKRLEAENQAEEKRLAAEAARIKPLRDYWNNLSADEQRELEQEALGLSDGFMKKRYVDARRAGQQEVASEYLELIVNKHIELHVLKGEKSEAGLAAIS